MINIEPGKFGYIPDPASPADYSFKATLAPRLIQAAAGDVDLRPFCTETNQFSASSCVGNATADAVEIRDAIEGRPRVQLSRLFVYTLARNMMDMDHDGRGDINVDHGTQIRLAFDVLSKFGICTETTWAYDLSKLFVLPSLKAMREATGHRIHSYYRIDGTGNERCDQVIQALRGNHPVVFGTQIDTNFFGVHDSTPVGVPTGKIEGGHAMIVVGYSGGNFIVKNSWGQGWGDGGFWYMTPEYLGWDRTQDIWVPTGGTTFKAA